MLSKKLIKVSRLLVLILPLVALTGCARKAVTVYPIRTTDIRVTDDEVIMSKWYFNNVLKVKLEEGR